jgi:hypothetical protein
MPVPSYGSPSRPPPKSCRSTRPSSLTWPTPGRTCCRKRGPGYTPYLASEVRALAATYIFVPEISRRGEMHARRAVSWPRSKGIQPAIALQDNRDFGYQRSAVEPLLAELTGETAQLKASLAAAGDTVQTRLIKAVAAGAGNKAIAAQMRVGHREAKRWVEVWRETGAVTERKHGYRSKLDDHEDFLRELERGLGQDALAGEGPETMDLPEGFDEWRNLEWGRR